VKRLFAAVVVLLSFLRAVAVAGSETAWVILRASGGGSRAPRPGFIRMRFAPLTEQGAALLGCMVTLTPGTTTIDVDMQRRELLLHVLDLRDPEGQVTAIRRDFERYLVVLFGADSG